MVFVYTNVYCLEISYDSDEMRKVVRQKCRDFYQKNFIEIKEIDSNYSGVAEKDIDACECSVYASYKVFGADYMDDFIKQGVSSAKKYITRENVAEFNELNFQCMEK